MGKVKNEIKKIHKICERLYEAGGTIAVIDYIEEAIRQGQDMIVQNVQYAWCDACDCYVPSIDSTCLCCGQETKITKQQLVDAVIEDLKKSFAHGDYTVLNELLSMLSIKNLVQALPEERWKEFEDLNKDYFNIKSQGYNHELEREEIQIHCGENGNLFLIKTEDGFIVDVYNQGDNVDTMAIWEEDLE